MDQEYKNYASIQDLQLGKWIASAAVGALVMYMLDPDRGRERRAVSSTRLRELGRQTGDMIDKVSHSAGTSAGGPGERTGIAPSLAGRIMDRLAGGNRSASQAGHDGDASATADAGNAINSSNAGSSAALRPQGLFPPRPPGTPPTMADIIRDLRARSWVPSERNLSLFGGSALGLFGMLRPRSPVTTAAGLAGMALLARGAMPGTRTDLAAGQGQRIDVHKSIRIDAAPEQVYDTWANYDNFPRFMSNVIDVRDLGERRSHWVVKGPAGSRFEWDAELTEASRPRLLAWRSLPGSEIDQRGEVRFDPVRGGTRVNVHLSYLPVGGKLGQTGAALLGSDPASQLEDDLANIKMLIERGALPHPSARGSSSAAHGSFLH